MVICKVINAYFPPVMLWFLIKIPFQKLPPGVKQLFRIRKRDIETFLGCSEWLKLYRFIALFSRVS